MSHDIYIFGSTVRGEVSPTSDIDVLVIPFSLERQIYPPSWSIYSSDVIQAYFRSGRLFAWHLYLEAKCIYSKDPIPFLTTLGSPSQYSSAKRDIADLAQMLHQSLSEIRGGTNSLIYELGIVYTAIRDIAMAASWSLLDKPCFSRNAPYLIPLPCPFDIDAYHGAMLARHSSTRGIEYSLDTDPIVSELQNAPLLRWINDIESKL